MKMWLRFKNCLINLDTINMIKIKKNNEEYSNLKFFNEFKCYNFKIKTKELKKVFDLINSLKYIDMSDIVVGEDDV